MFPVLWRGCDVFHSGSEALKTTKGNESFLGFCRKLSVVAKSGVTGGSGPGEQNDRRMFMGCVKKKHCSRLTGQLKFNMSSWLCQPARHLDRFYGCSGVCSVHSSQQDVIKGTAAKSKPTVRRQWAAGALVLAPTQFDSSTWNKKK